MKFNLLIFIYLQLRYNNIQRVGLDFPHGNMILLLVRTYKTEFVRKVAAE
jgi:hypothetical protein